MHRVTPSERYVSKLQKREKAEARGKQDADKFAKDVDYNSTALRAEWSDTLKALSTMQDFIERGYWHGYARQMFENYRTARGTK
jgi:hypothetical protein